MEVRLHRGEGKLQHIIEIGPHRIITDAPRQYGGDESGPEPHDILDASLAACTGVTLAMYAQRKGMDLQDIEVRISHKQEGGAYVMTRHLRYTGNLSDEEKQRLTEIAEKCPVHKTLTGEIRIVTMQD
ncbi:OsmC family peroxiredoxin [Oxalobacteraceae bacterium OM1]|nr:OsmC family peroxiredoxin [Oxalobacteraceae bacterium OM1]